jgi:predicted MPP superfamily phosphohydrolase
MKYPGLVEFVRFNLIKGITTKDIYDTAVVQFSYNRGIKTFRKYISSIKKNYLQGQPSLKTKKDRSKGEEFLGILKKRKVVNGNEICDELCCSPDKIFEMIDYYRNQGHEIICEQDRIILSHVIASEGTPIPEPLEDTEIIFGVASDLHFGSKECQITHLKEFAEICRKKGVKYMFVPGDVCAGYNVYPGQQFEVYALSAEEQEESVILNLPKGFEYYVIGGNHDYSFIKRGGGHNPMLSIEAQRSDFHYIGFDDADVPILPGVDMKMLHPSGGVPYSYSYRLQKNVEQIAYSELAKISRNVKDKPSIRFLLSGHLHIQLQSLFGTILGMQCGCFEGQTSYLKRKGLYPTVGGYIVQADMRKRDGMIMNFDTKFYVFPDHIEDDWKNYDHTITKPKIDKPLFNY